VFHVVLYVFIELQNTDCILQIKLTFCFVKFVEVCRLPSSCVAFFGETGRIFHLLCLLLF